ncbi:hypothetical protein IEI94_14480 [Halomonas sp. ML-15]|uniref:YrbL family protein n=1 Tax=Halomonas sp. ML-15 TaxID=2773305 RepID=UPI001746E459|nr:YrbL family protein [Halomonas sp. ML-15]MBD3897061.1 hypothetical protein [Halomonas sp. ML-15]
MRDASMLIRLAHTQPLASGGSRLIYPHPEQPGQLIKVIKGRESMQPKHRLTPTRLKARFQLTRQLRELREHIRILDTPSDLLSRHLPRIDGLVATDLGVGLVVEAIRDVNGRLAPTLSQLLGKSLIEPRHRDLLAIFFERLIASTAIVGDLSYNNLVLGQDVQGNDYFALVDGLGDNTLVPMYALVPGRNVYKKRQAEHRFLSAFDAALGRTAVITATPP